MKNLMKAFLVFIVVGGLLLAVEAGSGPLFFGILAGVGAYYYLNKKTQQP